MKRPESDRKTRVTVLVALGANLVIAAAKGVGAFSRVRPPSCPKPPTPWRTA